MQRALSGSAMKSQFAASEVSIGGSWGFPLPFPPGAAKAAAGATSTTRIVRQAIRNKVLIGFPPNLGDRPPARPPVGRDPPDLMLTTMLTSSQPPQRPR